ncbi:MAG: DUF1501 domain-containing protein [Actinomycetota bacterium]|nr:DUF1501 domain-containing protein [Actinomycetota bacterium]
MKTATTNGTLSVARLSALNRRRFLTLSGVTAAGALVAGCTSHPITPAAVRAGATATPLDRSAGVLVMVTLYGGNDGLNTLIPASDPVYLRSRPDLAYQAHDVLDLGSGLGLNPGMKGLKSLWDNKELAIVRGVGYPQPDHSHFRSMAIWQTASPATAVTTGWLGRWLDDTGKDPLQAVSLDPVMPPLMAGATRSAAAFPTDGLQLPTGALGQALTLLGTPCGQDNAWQAAAATSISELKVVADKLNPAVAKAKTDQQTAATASSPAPLAPATGPTPSSADPDSTGQQGASAGGQGELDVQLGLVAAMVEMGSPTRAYSVSLGGFDTHSDERGTQQRLLTELDTALSNFQRRLQSTDRGRQVVTIVYSEFGRRVIANASDGTDHGTAGPMFVLGRGVKGGFFGDEPSLADLDAGDLKVTTDFRSVYATALESVLGSSPEKYLGGWNQRIDGLVA